MIFLALITGLVISAMFFWGIYCVSFVDSISNFQGFASLGIFEISGLMNTIVFPLIFLLLVLAISYMTYFLSRTKKEVLLFRTSSVKNQNLLAQIIRNMNESNQAMISSNFFTTLDFIFEDFTDKILQIIKVSGLINPMTLKAEMEKSSEKPIFRACKILIACEDNNPNFSEILRRGMKKDEVLHETILDFIEGYDKLRKTLKEKGVDVLMLDFISHGSLGQVSKILKRIEKTLRKELDGANDSSEETNATL